MVSFRLLRRRWSDLQARGGQLNHEWHVKSLLEAGALADATDIYGDTPLHMAVAYGYHECLKHFTDILDDETLTRTLATHNMYGQRPMDLAHDPRCRSELRRAVVKVGRSVETCFMRVGLSREETVIAQVLSQLLLRVANLTTITWYHLAMS